MKPGKYNDPHWGTVVEIAVSLWVEGRFLAEVNPSPTQRYVDLLWAAHRAGRVLGGRAK